MTRTFMLPASILLLAALSLFAAGCSEARHLSTAFASSSKPYEEFLEDPVTLTTIKTIAVFPFDNRAPQSGFDAEVFANKLANQMAVHGKVQVIYPNRILQVVEKENYQARRFNADLKEKLRLGLYVPEHLKANAEEGGVETMFASADDDMRPRRYYDPVRNMEEAVRLGRLAKADAVIVGEISDFDPYMRPRISLTMRLIATGNTDTAAQAIAELTQWGVPRQAGGGARGTIYVRQESFDSTFGSVGMDVSKYGRTHFVDNHPYDTEVYIRSMTKYYDVVTSQLAKAYFEARQKAVKEAEERARAAAKARQQDQEAAVRRMRAMMERDARIPDYETDARGEEYFDQAFPEKRAYLEANGGDKRIMSWRPEGRSIRPATTAERLARDSHIPENERGRGLEGYKPMMDSAFPDADEFMEANMGDSRDRSWRPDYYNKANPQKSAPLYNPNQFVGGR